MKKIIKEAIQYDDETIILPGAYEYEENGINSMPMIFVNGEWLDWCED